MVQAGAEIASNSGRWVKLTKESAAAVQKYGLTPTKTPGVSHAMVGKPGNIKQWIQIAKAPGKLGANPAMLAGAAGIMTQLAMQQTMDEITDYLATIDEKLDAVMRAQTNQVLARLDGVELAVREATAIRDTVGRVSEVTWSKVDSSSSAIFETQGYALRQLKDLADEIEGKRKVGDLAKVAERAEAEVDKWMVVLARCFQLSDEAAILELDRVLDSAPDELDRHRLGLKAARAERLALISGATERLLDRVNAAASIANSKVLLNPTRSPAIVASRNEVVGDVRALHEVLGIESVTEATEHRRWRDAAGERWDRAVELGGDGVDVAKRAGGQVRDKAQGAQAQVRQKLAKRGGPEQPGHDSDG